MIHGTFFIYYQVSDVEELTQKITKFIYDTPDLHRRILQYEVGPTFILHTRSTQENITV
jgi:hypothetical protein